MALVSLWIDWAEREPGPEWKVYDTVNGGYGIVWHSMEGWYAGSMAELHKVERQASWMFSIKLDGALVQHYPVTASCWASGNGLANTQWWSVELEGVSTMPINDAQMATAKRLIGEWQAYRRAKDLLDVATRVGNLWTKTMWEHREVDTIAVPNAGETACPSERYARLWAVIDTLNKPKEADMTDNERALLLTLATVLFGRADGQDYGTVDEALAAGRKLAADDIVVQLGLFNTQVAMAKMQNQNGLAALQSLYDLLGQALAASRDVK